MSDPRLFQIALTKILGIGSIRGKQLVAYCGGVEAVFEERKSLLLKIPGIDITIANAIANANASHLAQADLKYVIENDIKVNFFLNEDYPKRLTHVDDGPLLFYSKGQFQPDPARTVAIVGTRKPTQMGKELCATIIRDLKSYNVQIISGLAYGIDAAAHKAACANDIENIAVMGTGIDQLYPAAHRQLSNEILKNGALLSEYPINSRPDRENFPRRNRVIAAMADVTIVVQSAAKGGSLITAEFANQYFKDVFAFPGRVNDKEYAGCNGLIKKHKAHLLNSIEDIVYIMRWEESAPNKAIQRELFIDLTKEEEHIMSLLRKVENINIDKLHKEASITMSQLSSILLSLEFKWQVRSIPGKRYQIV